MTTFIVRASDGDDAKDGLTFANAFATVQKLLDTVAAGDLGLIASDGVHTISTTILIDAQNGTFAAPIDIRGASSIGVDDGSIAVLDGADTLNAIFDDRNTGGAHLHFEGLQIKQATLFAFRWSNPQPGIRYTRCRIDNHGGEGIQIGAATVQITFIDCELDHNVTSGIRASTADDGQINIINCLIHNNGDHGIDCNHILTVQDSWIFANGNDGIHCISAPTFMSVTNCVIDNNGEDGIKVSSTNVITIIITNNIISNNTGWGVTLENTVIMGIRGNNLYFNNTLGDVSLDGTNEATFAAFETLAGSITGDPLFTSTTLGSEDYRIASDSPAFGVGFPGTLMESTSRTSPNFAHIGSNTPEVVAAGGGIIGG